MGSDTSYDNISEVLFLDKYFGMKLYQSNRNLDSITALHNGKNNN